MGEDYQNQTKPDENKIQNFDIFSNQLQVEPANLTENLETMKKGLKDGKGLGGAQTKMQDMMKKAEAKRKAAAERKKQKELEKRMCEDCGGLKPPPMSARSKQQQQLLKAKQDAARKRAAMARKAEVVERAVNGLPGPVRAALQLCGIGVKKKKQQTLSYHALSKVIRTLHPVDPLTGFKFDIWDSVTVADFNIKLIDACGCQTCFKCFESFGKKVGKLVSRKKDKGLEKPDSMADVPDGEAADSFQGLSKAALYIGEGPILYLQIMKTLSVLCVLLTLLNLPLFLMFSSNAGYRVNMFSLNSLFEHFSLGNVGFNYEVCQASHIAVARGQELHPKLGRIDVHAKKVPINDPIPLDFKCHHDDEYIYNIAAWGFLQKIDLSNETFSDAVAKCSELDPDYDQPDAKKLEFDEDAPHWEPHRTHSKDEEILIEMLEESEKAQGMTIDEEYNEALLLPEIYPDTSNKYNIDTQCDIHTMFETDEHKIDFFLAIEQACFLKNKCIVNPENLKINITVKEEESIEEHNFEEVEKDPNGKWVVKTVKLSNLLSQKCYKRIYLDEQTSPEFIALPNCIRDYVVFGPVPNLHFHKEELGLVAVISDIVSVCIIYYFFGKLKSFNQEYLTILDNNVIRMKDFTIQVRRVRIDNQTQDLRILKLKIWMHFTEMLKKFRFGENQMEVVDVQFSFSKHDKHFAMYKLQEIKNRLEVIEQKLQPGESSPAEIFMLDGEKKTLIEKYQRFETRYTVAIENEVKWAFNVSSCPANKILQFVEYTYVTFKSNQAPAKAIELFVKETTSSKFARSIFCIEDEIKDNVELEEQHLEVNATVDPDQIIWNNIGFSIQEQQIRSVVAIIVQIFTAIFALYVTLAISKFGKVAARPSPVCEEPDLTADPMDGVEEALAAQQLATAIRIVQAKKEWMKDETLSDEDILHKQKMITDKLILSDEMICFCKAITRGGYTFWNIFTVEWDKNTDENQSEPQPNYCLKWVGDTFVKQIVSFVTETSAVILNSMIASAFSHLSKFKKKHTTIEEQSTGFAQIFFMEFFNLGLVLLITSFDPSGSTQRLAGQDEPIIYKGFENIWYATPGKRLCFSLFMSAFATNLGEIKTLATVLKDRFADRKFLPNLKKDLEDQDDDQVNSQKLTQAEVEDLYTGGEFDGEKTFSRMMATLLIVVSYSSGMPILYFVGAFFFGATYLVNKIMLSKYYQKSLTLNRVVPQFSMQFLSVSLGMHILFGCFMLTNGGLFETVTPAGTAFQLPTLPFNPGKLLREKFDVEEENVEKALLQNEGLVEEESDFTKKFVNIVSGRIMFIHQQIYLCFVIGMIVTVIAGQFAKDVLDFVVNKLTQLILFFCKLIFSCLTYIARKIYEKIMELRRYCRRQLRVLVKFLNYKIKSYQLKNEILSLPDDDEPSSPSVLSPDTKDQKEKIIPYEFLVKPEDNDKIILHYNQIMALSGIIVATSQLKDASLKGYLRKKVHEIEIFQMSVYPLRYYIIDFDRQRMFVKHGKDIDDEDEFDCKVIYFREILKCHKMPEDDENEAKAARHYPADKQFPFYLFTKDRRFELCAQTEQESELWISCFEYIAECTRESKTLKFDVFRKARKVKVDENAQQQAKEFMKQQAQKKQAEKAVQRFIDQIWDVYDEDGTGGLDIKETKGFLLDNWDNLGFGQTFDDAAYEKAFKDFDEDGSNAIEKDEMAGFLDKFLNPPEAQSENEQEQTELQADPSKGPKLARQKLKIKGQSQDQKEIADRDKQMKNMSTQEKIKFIREWHEKKRKEKLMEEGLVELEEDEDSEEVEQRNLMLARYRIQIEKPYLSDNIYMEMSIYNLKLFYDRARKEQNDINNYFLVTLENEQTVLTPVSRGKKKPELRIQFEERCFMTKLSHLEVVQFLDFMKQRISDIEKVIDVHFDIVKLVIIKEKQGKLWRQMKKDQQQQKKVSTDKDKTTRSTRSKSDNQSAKGKQELEDDVIKKAIRDQLAIDPELQFENPFICTYDKKLQQLQEYEDQLLHTDRMKKENRRKQQTICRMQGSMTQSYFLWDASEHKLARALYYDLESRQKEEESDNQEEIERIYTDMAQTQQRQALQKVEEEAKLFR